MTLYGLAQAHCEQGRIEEGIALLRQAITADPQHARALNLLGMALGRLGRHAEALAALDRAIAIGGAGVTAVTHGSRADALVALGRFEEALASFDRALSLAPASAADWCNRGAALYDLGRYEDAVASYDRAVSLQPDFAEAHCNRGTALERLGRHADAVASYDDALAIQPDYLDALSNRATSLDQFDGRRQEALASADAALAIDAEHRGALITRGIILRKLGRSSEALASCDRALAMAADDLDALIARADILIDLEGFEEAIEALDRVIAINPDAVGSKWNKSVLCLGLGRFTEGWELYEHRWAGAKGLVPRDYFQARWSGNRLEGTLLVWGEQGLGDEILHSSMIPDLVERTGSLVLEVEPRLVPLLRRSFPSVKVIGLAPDLYGDRINAQTPLGSLGKHFRASWDAFPRRERGYLAADSTRTQELRQRLAHDGRTVIGLSWISKAPIGGQSKSAKLRDFETLLRLPGCRFVDLQYGDTLAERDAIKRDVGIEVIRLPDIDNTNDIDGLAALMTACDLVVTVSNTTAHLAGALGRPTWVMVPHGHARIWYWFLNQVNSPWYPRVRVFRQRSGQSWRDVVAAVTTEITPRINSVQAAR
jgi:tetratricopeptide (TPR) repeat protein